MATWGPGGVQGGEPIKQIDLADIFNRAETIRNNRLQNRLAQMQMENENKRRGIMQNSIIPAQPQQGTPAQPAFDPNMSRSYSGEPMRNALTLTRPEAIGGGMSPIDPRMANASVPASPDYQAARPAGFDYQGAQNQLIQAGMVPEAAQVGQMNPISQDFAKMAQIGDIAKNNPQAGEAAWNAAGFNQKYGDFKTILEKGKAAGVSRTPGEGVITERPGGGLYTASGKPYTGGQLDPLTGTAQEHNPTEASLALMASGSDPEKARVAREALSLLQGAKESKPAPTINTDKGLMQWNPKTQAYDIYAGKGAEAAKEERANKKEDLRTTQGLAKADLVINKVDDALKQVGFFTTGLTGSTLARVSGTSATDLENTIDTIKANIGFDTLSDMRAASPTGGALGQVSDRELTLLTSAVSSLKIGQSRGQLEKNLKEIKQHYDAWKKTVSQANNEPTKAGQRSSTGNSKSDPLGLR